MSLVEWSIEGNTGRLHLNRPEKRNALSGELVRQGRAAIGALTTAGVVVATLTAAGPVFCAGDDVSPAERGRAADLSADRFVRELAGTPICWVASVATPVFGAGVALVAACAVVVCSTEAAFGLPERRLGIFPGFVVERIAPIIGARRALAYAIGAEPVSAEQALRDGLVTEVVAASALAEATAGWVDRMVAQPLFATEAGSYWRQLSAQAPRAAS